MSKHSGSWFAVACRRWPARQRAKFAVSGTMMSQFSGPVNGIQEVESSILFGSTIRISCSAPLARCSVSTDSRDEAEPTLRNSTRTSS